MADGRRHPERVAESGHRGGYLAEVRRPRQGKAGLTTGLRRALAIAGGAPPVRGWVTHADMITGRRTGNRRKKAHRRVRFFIWRAVRRQPQTARKIRAA
ncbi:hypothetical protein METUNv1_00683 [Methyloversatilis universalis FAM5]|uniref:Uncharacterized protein n=1 Tax=Methyloversatilis universalis (strain ATCC BAA-1314 / DSM 25237 / JCM 13912 / CCUG 52030 / FAM5) TaxID=1000565 RepID=F5R963_METUF|nr:hypothetical protein METUNv1_00683 [Methyloversatilis universalis FAM5]